MPSNLIFDITFSIDGKIIIHPEYNFKHEYKNLNEFFCVCALNDNNIPSNEQEYFDARKLYFANYVKDTHVACHDNYLTFEGSKLSRKPKDVIQFTFEKFFELSSEDIEYMQERYSYFTVTNVLEDKLQQIMIEIAETDDDIDDLDNDLESRDYGSTYEQISKMANSCSGYLERLLEVRDIIYEEIDRRQDALEFITSKMPLSLK